MVKRLERADVGEDFLEPDSPITEVVQYVDAGGTCMFSAAAVERDTEIMMTRAVKADIPLIIGLAGTSGSDAGLAWMMVIACALVKCSGGAAS
jgi:hypothetical protein